MSISIPTAPVPSPPASAAPRDLFGRGDYYGFLNAVQRQWESALDDPEIVRAASQAYVAIGLIGPARELLTGLSANDAEAHQLLQQIRRAPSGRVAWGSMQERFERNVERLYARHPHLREHDELFRSVPRRLELFRSRDGNLHVSPRSAGGTRRWVPGLYDVKNLVAQMTLPHDPNMPMCGAYLIAGDRFNALLDRVWEATHEMFLTYSPRIYVIEPDLDRFAVTLYVSDTVDRLCHGLTSLFVGPGCTDAFGAYLAAHPRLTIPAYVLRMIGLAPADSEALMETVSRVHEQRDEEAQAIMQRLRDHYDSLPAGHWKERFAEGQRLRVLGLTSRFTTFLQHSMRDWQTAIEGLGHDFRLLIEPTDHDLYSPITIAETIADYKPDLVVVIDHLRNEYPEVIPNNLPFVCWIQDKLTHLVSSEAGRSIGPTDFVCGFCKDSFVREHEYPADHFFHCVIPTTPRLYDPAPVELADRERHACDVSATTHASKSSEQMLEEYAAQLREPLARRLLNVIHDEVTQRVEAGSFLTPHHIRSLVHECEQREGVQIEDPDVRSSVFLDFAARVHDRMTRHRTLEWIGRWAKRTGRTFAIYGNGWKSHPVLSEFARGPIDNGYDLRCVYQASTISLHVSGFGAVHQRVLDGLSSGGFLMVRHNPANFLGEAGARLLAAIREYRVQTVGELIALEDPAVRAAIERFRATGWSIRDIEPKTPVSSIEQYLRAKVESPTDASQPLPRFAEVNFDSEDSFAERAEHFLAHPEERRAIARGMREAVRRLFSYDGFTRSLLDFIRERLPEPTATSAPTARE